MFRARAFGVLWKLAKGSPETQARTFAPVCGAFVLCGQPRSLVVARKLAGQAATRFKGGLQRYDRGRATLRQLESLLRPTQTRTFARLT